MSLMDPELQASGIKGLPNHNGLDTVFHVGETASVVNRVSGLFQALVGQIAGHPTQDIPIFRSSA